MIFKSLIITLILLAAYAGLLSFLALPKEQAQNQWQDNVIKAQEYIYSNNKKDLKVIVGSSLSCHFVMNIMPADFYNLSFAGKSLFEGVNVILKSNPKPAKIYIEMNFIKRESDPAFTDDLFTPLVYVVKEKMSFLQEKNQPLTFLGNYISPKAGKYLIDPFTGRFWNPLLDKFQAKQKPGTTPAGNFKESLVDKQVKNFSIPFENEEIRKKFVLLKQEVTELTQAGVQVAFFEMPMNPAIENSLQMKSGRQLFEEYFPRSLFTYLPKPVYTEYTTTTDGLHLVDESALRFTRYFLQFAK